MIEKVCKECSNSYVGYKQSRYCSNECANKAKYRQRRNRKKIYERFVWKKEYYPILVEMLNNRLDIEVIANTFGCNKSTVKLRITKLDVKYEYNEKITKE